MFLTSVMKRKDASSVLVAVVLAMVVSQFVTTVTTDAAFKLNDLLGGETGPDFSTSLGGSGWQGQYLHPFLWMVLQVLAFEVLARVYVWVAAQVGKRG